MSGREVDRESCARGGAPDFSGVAPLYRWLEYVVFGRLLERARNEYIDQVIVGCRILLLGDGDGRFLERCLKELERAPRRDINFESLDCSRGMVESARRRIRRWRTRDRVTFRIGEALGAHWTGRYDRVVTHFFLDCFSESEIAQLAKKVNDTCTADCIWVISEFAVPSQRFAAWVGRLLIRVMYWFFRWTAALSQSRLPRYAAVLEEYGFERHAQKRRLGGFVVSELWKRSASRYRTSESAD